jgi:predicted Zn-ribbon and HTH transcriptional regulator
MNIQLSRNLFLLCLSILILASSGCKKEKGKEKEASEKSEEVVTVDTIDKKLVKDVKAVKEMFYSMPSPLEVAMILKQAGKEYNPEILNPVKNTSKYVTNKRKALNLGVYTTDLSYSSLYDQTQTTIDYINAAKDMAEGLGMLHAIDEKTIDRLEANVNNRDVILDIISETIMNSSSFFKENDRQAISTIILVGGWVEGLYIATNLVGDSPSQSDIDDSELIARIADQKLALNTIMKLLNKNQDDDNIQSVTSDIKSLKKIYDKIEITSSKVVPVTDEETNVTTLKSETTISMTPEIYNELKKRIEVIRNKFTS